MGKNKEPRMTDITLKGDIPPELIDKAIKSEERFSLLKCAIGLILALCGVYLVINSIIGVQSFSLKIIGMAEASWTDGPVGGILLILGALLIINSKPKVYVDKK